jgi:hypothetical protein
MRSRVGSAAQLKHARNSRQSDNDALLTKGIANASFGSTAEVLPPYSLATASERKAAILTRIFDFQN